MTPNVGFWYFKSGGDKPPALRCQDEEQLNPGRILHLFSVGTALRSAPYFRSEAAILFDAPAGAGFKGRTAVP